VPLAELRKREISPKTIPANILTMTNMMRPERKTRGLEEEDIRPALEVKTLGGLRAAPINKERSSPAARPEDLDDDPAGFARSPDFAADRPASRSRKGKGAGRSARASDTKDAPRRAGAGGKPAKPLTEARIRNIAEHYVGQRECSRAMLRSVLERRLSRRLYGMEAEEAERERDAANPLIDAEVKRLARAGFIDDRRFAEMKARSWLNAGRGSRRILMDLKQKGIDDDTAQDALMEASREITGMRSDEVDAQDAVVSAEWEAADAFAQKKRVGKYRTKAFPEDRKERAKIWRREAAAMARAGFGIDMIRQVLDEEPEDDDFS